MGSDEIHQAESVLLLAAHYDDEVIGAGSRFAELGGRLRIVHVTDSAPRDLSDARQAGYATHEDYARGRRSESLAAGALAGISEGQFECLGVVDQEAAWNLESIVRQLAAILKRLKPAAVITHPYEGGHPDHDSAAFAARAAALHVPSPPAIWEWTSYHASPGGELVTGRFAGSDAGNEIRRVLNPHQRKLKREMFECFRSQRSVLAWFPLDEERYRAAPVYDFTRPPNQGRLFYETQNWGMSGERFCSLAARASESLELYPHVTHDS